MQIIILLDILAMMKVRGEEVSIEGTNELHTPGKYYDKFCIRNAAFYFNMTGHPAL